MPRKEEKRLKRNSNLWHELFDVCELDLSDITPKQFSAMVSAFYDRSTIEVLWKEQKIIFHDSIDKLILRGVDNENGKTKKNLKKNKTKKV